MSALPSLSKTDGDNAVHAVLQCSRGASSSCSNLGALGKYWRPFRRGVGTADMTTDFTPSFRDGFNGTVIGFPYLFNKMVSLDQSAAASTRKVRLSTEEVPK
jgi:hypothetical protein